jgi:hypothetical protein
LPEQFVLQNETINKAEKQYTCLTYHTICDHLFADVVTIGENINPKVGLDCLVSGSVLETIAGCNLRSSKHPLSLSLHPRTPEVLITLAHPGEILRKTPTNEMLSLFY